MMNYRIVLLVVGLAVGTAALAQGAELTEKDTYLQGALHMHGRAWEKALDGFGQIADADSPLAGYARLRAAECLARLDRTEDAIAAYRRVLEAGPGGPWRLRAQAKLAALLAHPGTRAEAAALFAGVLDSEPQPWWMDDLAGAAAKNLLEIPERREEAFAWLQQQALYAPYAGPRRDAARLLLDSPNPRHRAAAVLGLLRSGAYKEAAKALEDPAATLRMAEDNRLGPDAVRDLLFSTPDNAVERRMFEKRVDTLAAANTESLWARNWLIYAMRMQAAQNHLTESRLLCNALVRHFGDTREAGEVLWWLGRHYERDDRPAEAASLYARIASDCPESYRADDGLHKAAEYALETDRAAAVKLFLRLGKQFPDSRFRPHAYYVLARFALEDGDAKAARLYLAHAAHNALGRYYAHRALERLHRLSEAQRGHLPNLRIDGTHSVLLPMPGRPVYPTRLPARVAEDPRVLRMHFFGAHGLEEGEWEVLALCKTLRGAPDPGPWYRCAAEAGFMHTALGFADVEGWGLRGGRPTRARLEVMYPRAYWPRATELAAATGLDPYLFLAVARQESTFRANIQSWAGASGVMQIMPATARWMARVEPAVTQSHINRLDSPQNSLLLGAYYLLRMHARSNGNLIYALASYNAGPGNCDKWRKRFGTQDMDAFVRAIPFGETKDYVKKVLGNYAAYRTLYPAYTRQ